MSNLGKKVLLYRTEISGKIPNVADIAVGELALNYNVDTPFIAFKDTNNELQKIGTLKDIYTKSEVDNLIPTKTSELENDSNFITLDDIPDVEHKLSESYESVIYSKTDLFTPASANQTLDEAIKTVDTNISILVNEVLKNEEVIAAALTKHNESCGFDENANYIVNENANIISGATSLADADNLLDSAINNIYDELQQQIPSLDGYATESYVNTQITNIVSGAPDTLNTLNELAAALNDDANFATTVTNQLSNKSDKDHTHTFNEITEKPTTLNGYGIIDASINELTKTIILGENSLTITDLVLSDNYISVVYPEDTGDKTFIPAISGQTLDDAVFTVETNVATLVQSVLENEEVTAAALTKHNESAGFDENANYIVNESATYISAATSLAEADNLLDAAILNLSNSLSSLEGYATEDWVNNKGYVTLTEVESKVSELVDSAPDTLNTLNELAAALNDDANFATTVTNQIATKANSSDVYTKTESDDKYALKTALETANNTIATLQTTISNLETKIANIIAAVGLNTDGTFIVPTTAQTSGYTTASTSVMSAVVLMDNQIEENETVTAYALTDLNDRLTVVEDNINNSQTT